jgi:hypothetical protein
VPLTGSLQKPITLNYSIYQQHSALILTSQKLEVDKERLSACKIYGTEEMKDQQQYVCLVGFWTTYTPCHIKQG